MNNQKLNSREAEKIVQRILVDGVISTFEYWSEFNIRVEVDAGVRKDGLIPPAFQLRLRGNWWIGEKDDWESRVRKFPVKARTTQNPADPLRASLIMRSLGASIAHVKIADDATLFLATTDADTITVPSRDTQWEESWMIELPSDDPQKDNWIILCDDHGEIFGRVPEFFYQ